MKKMFITFISMALLAACSSNEKLEVFSFDARTKDVALENFILVSNGTEAYVQPTFQLYGIETLDNEAEVVSGAGIRIYDSKKNLIYSLNVGENQYGVLDTRTSPLAEELIGPVLQSEQIEVGKTIYVEFVYEKDSLEVREEVEVVLGKN